MNEARSKRVPYLAFFITVIAVVLMTGLGFWQLDRMAQKKARLASIEAKQQKAPLNLKALFTMDTDVRDVKVTFSGKAKDLNVLLLDNKLHNGQPGYHVLVPVEASEGSVLVNLGWVAAPKLRSELPVIDIDPSELEYKGRIAVPSVNPMVKETASNLTAFPARIQSIELAFLEQQLGFTLLPFTVQIDAPANEQFVRDWKPVVMPPQKHLAYALQWFGLAVAAIVVFLAVMKRNYSAYE